ncbi:MAG: hypothetical protein MTP17_03250 [Candidatus Midichloria sp.]|nr:MAG: hypothetical protein MTP17_03250 [Candidatus Midichloria sp.]
MLNILMDNPINFWVVAAISFIAIEIMLGWSVIFFFVLGSASLIVSIILSLNIILDIFSQMTTFFISTLIFSGAYWFLFKHFKKRGDNYKNMAGQVAHVVSEKLVKGEVGLVKWSGTVCKAMLHSGSEEDSIEVGNKVVILDIRNNILLVKKNF